MEFIYKHQNTWYNFVNILQYVPSYFINQTCTIAVEKKRRFDVQGSAQVSWHSVFNISPLVLTDFRGVL
jgi:hypothetical protein